MPGSFIENTDLAFSKQLKNFANKLTTYKTVLGFTDAEIAEASADAAYFDLVLQTDAAVETFAHNFKSYKNTCRHGNKQNDPLGSLPLFTIAGTTPTGVAANVQERFSQKAAKAKHSNNYTDAIGKDLGVVATTAAFDPTTGKPSFSISINANRPEISYSKGKYNGVSIYKDTGEGKGYTLLDKAFYATYTDRSTLPPTGKTALWKYKLIYLYHDQETGSFSNEASITVTGN